MPATVPLNHILRFLPLRNIKRVQQAHLYHNTNHRTLLHPISEKRKRALNLFSTIKTPLKFVSKLVKARRLEITDAVHAAEYQFQIVMGNSYWLVWEQRKQKTLLVLLGPNDWCTGVPEFYEYITQVKYMGDHTWMEIKED